MRRVTQTISKMLQHPIVNNRLTNNPLTRFAANAVGSLLNDPNLQQWFGHGVNEVANMVLHGHPAPIYARTVTPTEQSEPQINAGEEIAVTSHGPPASEPSPVETQAEQSNEIPAVEPVESLLEQTMQEVEQTAELSHPEQEMQV